MDRPLKPKDVKLLILLARVWSLSLTTFVCSTRETTNACWETASHHIVVIVSDMVPNETFPFGCHLTPDAGTCTTFDTIMETVDAALNAHTEVDDANDQSMLLSMEAYRIVADIEADVIAMNDVLRTIEPLRPHMTLEESIEIEKEAESIVDFVVESGRLAGIAGQNAAAVYKASREVTILKNEAVAAENEATKAERDLQEKQNEAENNEKACRECMQKKQNEAGNNGKACPGCMQKKQNEAGNNGKACPECNTRKEKVENFRNARREAARKAGEAAKDSREKRRKAAKHRQFVEDNRNKAKEAKGRLLSLVDKIKKRAAI
ncbi:cell wall anchor protein [Gracilaria domingensis]|nr:cell wall anchor protein [Gracilaria domingensis]